MKNTKQNPKNDPNIATESTEVTENTEETENKTETASPESDAAKSEVANTTEPKSEQPDVWQDKFVRLAADFDNFKKRSKAEKDAVYGTATADAVAQLLPVLDNLERALAAAPEENPLRSGVEMILTQTALIFEKMGVSPIGEIGDSFDPTVHNAILHIEDESLGENTVAQVLQKGYKLGDKVIRHALVQVAN